MAWSTKCAETAFVVVVVLSSVFNIFWRINLLWNCCTSLHTALQYLCDGLFGFCTIACPWTEQEGGSTWMSGELFGTFCNWVHLSLTHPTRRPSIDPPHITQSLPPVPPTNPCPCPSPLHITGDSGFRFQSLLMIYVTKWQHRLLPLGRILYPYILGLWWWLRW